MKRFLSLVIALATGLSAPSAFAGPIDPSAVITSTPVGTDFDYSITLTNSSATSTIGTFWFAWVPGKDFLPTDPFNITTPADWTDVVTHGGATDGFAMQFVAAPGALLAPGSSLSGFGFESSDSPSVLAGNSPFYTTFPSLTSFVYAAAPFGDPGQQFLVTSVPEPSSLVLGIFAFATSAGYLRFKKRKGDCMIAT
jgi:hypothetical protein